MTLAPLARQYLDLLKASLLNELYVENEAKLIYAFHCMANRVPLDFRQFRDFTQTQRELLETVSGSKAEGATLTLSMTLPNGQRKPADALRNVTELSHTMVGRARLDNLEHCVRTVIAEKVPGDFIETGIWRGGSCIFMRGVLLACDDRERVVWAADSFEGVPPPTLPQDAGFDISREVLPVLAVSVDEVKALFQRYGLLDDRVRFLKGWFKDSLKAAPIERLAILRLDGDLYESTMDALVPLYDKVQPGGFVIVDDYDSCPPCHLAIDDFRRERGIREPLVRIDAQSVFWRKG